MFRHSRLHEQRAFLRIEPGGEQRQRHIDRAGAQISRLVRYRDGVVVDDAEKRLVLVLQINPVLDGSEVISDVQRAGGLYAAEDAGHCAKLKSERDELQAISPTDPGDDELLATALEAARASARSHSRRNRWPREARLGVEGTVRLRQRSGQGIRAGDRRHRQAEIAERTGARRRADADRDLREGNCRHRGSPRWDDELPARLPRIRGLDRHRAGREACRRSRAQRRARRRIHCPARRRRVHERKAHQGLQSQRAWKSADRDRLPIQDAGRVATLRRAVQFGDARNGRDSSSRLGGARPLERRVRAIRCVLGADAGSVGRCGRDSDGTGSGRHRHGPGR